ncbi:hypothetical protein PLCT1_01380 [Planctomycetaceae bacterium]|nr:hypothetical protein PLCT1_01380 [Planctomycetaceae bacterium]
MTEKRSVRTGGGLQNGGQRERGNGSTVAFTDDGLTAVTEAVKRDDDGDR